MDDELLRESLAGFDALWRRVTGQEEDRPDDNTPEDGRPLEGALPRLISEEACAAAQTAALARLYQGESRSLLTRLSAEARRHLRRLRAEYYILTGADAGTAADCRPAGGKLASLRQIYLRAERLALLYERAAGLADGPARDALGELAEDERRAARQLRALLVASF